MAGLLRIEDAFYNRDDLRRGDIHRFVDDDPAMDGGAFLPSRHVRGASGVGVQPSSSCFARSRRTRSDLRMPSIFSASAKDVSSTKRRSGVNFSVIMWPISPRR